MSSVDVFFSDVFVARDKFPSTEPFLKFGATKFLLELYPENKADEGVIDNPIHLKFLHSAYACVHFLGREPFILGQMISFFLMMNNMMMSFFLQIVVKPDQ